MTKFLISILLITLLTSPAQCYTEPENIAKNKLNNISKKIKTNKNKIKQKALKKKQAQRELMILSRKQRYNELRLKKAKERLLLTKRKITKKEKTIKNLKKKYSYKKTQFTKRLVEIYKHNKFGLLECLFAPPQAISTIDIIYYFERIINSDIDLINDLKDQQFRLSSESTKLHKAKKKLVTLKLEIKKRERTILRDKKLKSRNIKLLSSEIALIERKTKDLRIASTEITTLIKKLSRGDKAYYGTNSFIKPVAGWLSSKFGRRLHPIFKRYIKHTGVDLAAPKGYKIKAADSGLVIVAGSKSRYKGYGKIAVIDHGRRRSDKKRISTVYAHMSRVLVKEGHFVKKGDVIGWVGSTGYSTGPHLHFEIRQNGVPVNPLKYIKI
ncbi:MAG: M23 family metallopeptidase [bacterium]|nr:M23 family metallopeptidase [bacterium]